MQKMKKDMGDIIIICFLALLIVLVIAAAALLFFKNSPSKKPYQAERENSKEAELESEDYYEEESDTEVSLNDFSVGSSAQIQQNQNGEAEEKEDTEEAGEYIIADSDSRYLTEVDLEGFTKEDLSLARNEIYARHGRMFDTVELQEYFSGKDWYVPTYPADEFPDNELNEYEKENAQFISKYEKENF